MVWTNIISQNKYIFPHIFLPHFNLSRGVSIQSLHHEYGKIKLKIIKTLQKEANTVFWILCKALCWCIYLKEFHFLLYFCCWTHRDFDRYELHYANSILTWMIQNFQRELEGMAYRKGCSPILSYTACAREQREPYCCLLASFNYYLEVTLSLITTCAWGTEKPTAVVVLLAGVQKNPKTICVSPSAPL